MEEEENRMNKIKTVIFDWAGTTVDYGCFAPVQAFAEAFRAYGIEPTIQEIREPMGMLKIDHIRTMLSMPRIRELWNKLQGRDWTEEDVREVYLLSERKLLEILPRFTELKPYVQETVAELRNRDIRIGSTTGYTDEMMEILVPAAAKNGYQPDYWISPDGTNGVGRPYPYMIFRNMEYLNSASVSEVMKVGDTVSDIREGKAAGVFTVGVIEGSSEMGLSQKEYEALSPEERETRTEAVRKRYLEAGADAVAEDIRGILQYL